jgi:hypothetical protein
MRRDAKFLMRHMLQHWVNVESVTSVEINNRTGHPRGTSNAKRHDLIRHRLWRYELVLRQTLFDCFKYDRIRFCRLH